MIAVTEQNLVVSGLPEHLHGLRVVHLTDFHKGTTTNSRLIEAAIETTNALHPDVILMTGDYVNHDPADVLPIASMLTVLEAKYGVYFILGNHDYSSDGDKMRTALENAGFINLTNRSVSIERGLWLCGVDDDRLGKPDIDAAFANIPAEAEPLVLIHNPAYAEQFQNRKCIAFAGHTHGGQVNLPIARDLALWRIGAKRYRAGWYDVGNVRLYVNRGIGNTGVRFRLFTPPEVTCFTLHRTTESQRHRGCTEKG